MLFFTDPPTVTVSVGDPLRTMGASLDADTKKIMQAIVAQLPAEAKRRREPTDAELMAKFPPRYSRDPRAEAAQRPGQDSLVLREL